jgi:hypothetical protein
VRSRSDPTWVERARAITLASPLPVAGDSIFARAFATGEPLHVAVTDALIRSRFPRAEDHAIATTLDIRYSLFVPLRMQNTSVGGLTLMRHGDAAHEFTLDEVQRALTLGTSARPSVPDPPRGVRLQSTARLSPRRPESGARGLQCPRRGGQAV